MKPAIIYVSQVTTRSLGLFLFFSDSILWTWHEHIADMGLSDKIGSIWPEIADQPQGPLPRGTLQKWDSRNIPTFSGK